ncbi:hypothetical protein GCM10009712_24490 [Pseudarthrobacter sulfonivorans]
MLPPAAGGRTGTGEYDAGARVPAQQLAGFLGVVGEKEVLHGVLPSRRTAGKVRSGVTADALLVRFLAGTPGIGRE